MNNYDAMIERYRRELMNTSSRSTVPVTQTSIGGQAPTPTDAAYSSEDSDNGYGDGAQAESLNSREDSLEGISGSMSSNINRDFGGNTANSLGETHIGMGNGFNNNADMGVGNGNNNMSMGNGNNNMGVGNGSPGASPGQPDRKYYGTLRIEVFAADRAYGIPSAKVTVTTTDDPSGEVIFSGYTDTSGVISDITLEAPSDSISEQPGMLKGYSSYDILVEHPRFRTKRFIGVPVFANVESVQPVPMTPASGNGSIDTVYEREPHLLDGTNTGNGVQQNA